MSAAPDEFARAVTEFFDHLTTDVSTPIAQIHSCDFAEDGKTLVILCVMSDGSDTIISLCPGLPISIHRTDAPPPTPKPRHLFAVRSPVA